MNTRKLQEKLFKSSSVTYYYSSLYFPKTIRRDVFTLYAFVRTADNFVDTIPQKKDEFYRFVNLFKESYINKKTTNDKIIDDFIEMVRRKKISYKWVVSFLEAMEMDLNKNSYKTFAELEKYMYGSANVIGLMMASVLELPTKSYKYAELLGKAMQYVNFIRDISEDIELGRIYMPLEELKKYKISTNSFVEKKGNANMEDLIKNQITKYLQIQDNAEKGFKYLPKKYRIPIETASNLYKWTATVIYNNPLIVFEKKIKPSPYHAMKEALSVWTKLR